MNNLYFLVYWFNYRHKSTVYPIYLEMKSRGLNVDGICYRNNKTDAIVTKFKKADAIITSSNCLLPYELGLCNKIVWTWHGVGNIFTSEGVADIVNRKVYKHHKLNLMIGAIDYAYFSKKMNNLKIVGYPKLDKIENIELDLPYKKTVLFVEAPHWKVSYKSEYFNLVKELVKMSDKLKFNLLIRPYGYGLKLYNIFECNSIKIIKEKADLTPYYVFSDLVISDILSSAIYEGIGLDKSVLYYDIMKHPKMCIDTLSSKPIGLSISVDNVEERLTKTLKNLSMFKNNRNDLKDKVYYKLDGNASKRAVDAILEAI